jgi:uncharacterized RDD family membrane protein YckC
MVGHGPDTLSSRPVTSLEIRTPEGIVLRSELAGAGSRFAAALIDGSMFVVLYLMLGLLSALVVSIGGGAVAEFLGGILLAGLIPVYVAFNALTHLFGRGQTVGKRVLGLRVTTLEGYPPSGLSLILRGLLLPVDALIPLPVPGIIGMAAIALTDRRQRLGDMVGATVVILEAPLPASAEPFPGESWSALEPKSLSLSPGLAARLGPEDFALLRDLLGRDPLEPGSKRELFVRTANHYAARLELGRFEDARVFLKELYLYLREARGGA